jgi:hypothetical protein
MTSASADTPDGTENTVQPNRPDPSVRLFPEPPEPQRKARIDAAIARLTGTIIPRLRKRGVAKVRAEYSSFGHSGAIHRIAYLDARDRPVNMNLVRAASDPDIKNVLHEFLADGFAVSQGVHGNATIDIAAGTVRIEHGEDFTATWPSPLRHRQAPDHADPTGETLESP